MTPKTRTALLQAIEHWERLKDGISPVSPEWEKAAQAEIDFLRGLLT